MKGYSKPKEHYTMCILKIYKSSPSNMVEFYLLSPENIDEMFEINR